MAEAGLTAEWEALRARDYAQEGIPMIVRVETVGAAPPRAGEAGIAAEFRELADALGDADKANPATILEAVAARELGRLA